MSLSSADARWLRRSFTLAARARAAGHHPFGAVLVDADGARLGEQGNPGRARTHHAESELARWAAERWAPHELAGATLYSSAEPCAMCAGTIYWAGIGRLVYGLSEHELRAMTGAHPQNPTLDLPCRTVFAAGQASVTVRGPELEDEARVAHEGFWCAGAARRPS